MNQSHGALGFTVQNTNAPAEAYAMKLDARAPVQVSRVNAEMPATALGRTRVIRWKGADGLDVEGLLTYPAVYEEGKRYPMLLVIHGGPTGVFTQSYIGNVSPYPVAAFAERGYAVLRCNIRGSSGYGKDFRYANYGDWGGKDFQDLMAGVDSVIAMGVAAPFTWNTGECLTYASSFSQAWPAK